VPAKFYKLMYARGFRRPSNDPCAPNICSLHLTKDQAASLLHKEPGFGLPRCKRPDRFRDGHFFVDLHIKISSLMLIGPCIILIFV